MKQKLVYLVGLILIALTVLIPITTSEEVVVLNYYYSLSCSACKRYTSVINEIEANFTENLVVFRKEVGSNQSNRQEWEDYGFKKYPSVVMNDETKIPMSNITYENLASIINAYVEELDSSQIMEIYAVFERLLAILMLFSITAISLYFMASTGDKNKEK